MFIDCLPWFNCLKCTSTSPETPKVYGLSFKSEVVRLIRDEEIPSAKERILNCKCCAGSRTPVSTWRRMCVPDRNVILANRSSVERRGIVRKTLRLASASSRP
ncbi:hypothetical protein QLX08_003625 [Tetragonisca angustula]|uniref:Uncharacterized protein n=1 Tax=Tetragonisca angustula TaxID=166442 RepID=A0AAW1A679_9HYME